MYKCVGKRGMTRSRETYNLMFFLLYLSATAVETLVYAKAIGPKIFTLKPEKPIPVRTGDVIGWVGNKTSGDLAFENTANEWTFFFSAASFNVSIGGLLSRLGGATAHGIKPVLRAHVSQLSQGTVDYKFMSAGKYDVSVLVENAMRSDLKVCPVVVEVRSVSAIKARLHWRFLLRFQARFRGGIASNLHGIFEIAVKSPRDCSKKRQCKQAFREVRLMGNR